MPYRDNGPSNIFHCASLEASRGQALRFCPLFTSCLPVLPLTRFFHCFPDLKTILYLMTSPARSTNILETKMYNLATCSKYPSLERFFFFLWLCVMYDVMCVPPYKVVCQRYWKLQICHFSSNCQEESNYQPLSFPSCCSSLAFQPAETVSQPEG